MPDPGDYIPHAIQNWVDELDGGGSVDLSNYVGEIVDISGTTSLHIGGNSNNATVELSSDGIALAAEAMGFFGSFPIARPEVPASPTVQDVVDALVALGLITQAP